MCMYVCVCVCVCVMKNYIVSHSRIVSVAELEPAVYKQAKDNRDIGVAS